ncbi:hypothetical protein HPP92_024231 [Vanilla planifolia]|uniref:NnrU domain-containing protein n=1 Tax=Vanilla planifolia TaxID=51239 RepID=A0A835UCR6_VANPL|nr:hypothetical protein HPP92_024231 [Vanilla planifolia]
MASSVFLLSSTSRFPSPRIPNCRNRDTRILPLFPIQKPLKCVGFSSSFHSKNLLRFLVEPRAVGGSETKNSSHEEDPVGEDSAAFELGEQKPFSWVYFTVILGSVLYALDVLWIDPSTGYGAAFVNAVSAISDSHEVVILVLIFIFAIVHSGLASFRDAGEKLIGERAYRVLFAGVSLPLALSSIVYFINHRYDGAQLWQIQVSLVCTSLCGSHPSSPSSFCIHRRLIYWKLLLWISQKCIYGKLES